ncbi:MAG TPA: MBL fold metallo-hydrolase [Thermoanaerobaculia bacterium]
MLRRSFAILALMAAPVTAAGKPPLIPANDLLLGHSNFFKPPEVWDLQETPVCKERLAPLAYKAYSAVGFNLANTIVLVGPDNGLVVVDTLGSDTSAKIALEAIRLRSKGAIKANADGKLPIKAIVYTHNHIDHTAGVDGVLALADRPACAAENTNDAGQDGTYIGRQDCVEVISQKQVVDSVINTGTVVGQMINPRSSYMYGAWIGNNRINDGIGLEVLEGSAGFRMPSRTFTNELLFSAAGINMKLIYVPSETDDEIAAFLPDGMNLTYPGTGKAPRNASSEAGWGGPGMLLSAEVIQGPSFPNLYSLRGTSYRNPAQWFESVDTLRKLDSWSMVPAHGVPLCGAEDIRVLLRNFRDAVQFTHDQALRRINQGNTPGELAAEIHMPEYLINDLGRMKKPKPDVRT